jgi:hypothetical protein
MLRLGQVSSSLPAAAMEWQICSLERSRRLGRNGSARAVNQMLEKPAQLDRMNRPKARTTRGH